MIHQMRLQPTIVIIAHGLYHTLGKKMGFYENHFAKNYTPLAEDAQEPIEKFMEQSQPALLA